MFPRQQEEQQQQQSFFKDLWAELAVKKPFQLLDKAKFQSQKILSVSKKFEKDD